MATVFKVIEQFCIDNHKCIVSREHRNKIGVIVANSWDGLEIQHHFTLPKVESIEPDGTYLVIDYPNSFSPIIRDKVEKYYDEMRANRKKIYGTKNGFTKLYRAS
jgi:hypothetical protein